MTSIIMIQIIMFSVFLSITWNGIKNTTKLFGLGILGGTNYGIDSRFKVNLFELLRKCEQKYLRYEKVFRFIPFVNIIYFAYEFTCFSQFVVEAKTCNYIIKYKNANDIKLIDFNLICDYRRYKKDTNEGILRINNSINNFASLSAVKRISEMRGDSYKLVSVDNIPTAIIGVPNSNQCDCIKSYIDLNQKQLIEYYIAKMDLQNALYIKKALKQSENYIFFTENYQKLSENDVEDKALRICSFYYNGDAKKITSINYTENEESDQFVKSKTKKL